MKIIFLGAQGSGKSTQAKMLAEELNLPYIEMGQLLRDKSKEDDEEASQIRQALETGNLVKDEITEDILKQRLEREDSKNGFILDGYPRNKKQLDTMTEEIDKVFYVNVSDPESVARLMLRGRADDSEELIKRRLDLYHSETEPLLEHFKNEGILEEINGEQTIEQVHEELKGKITNTKKNETENN